MLTLLLLMLFSKIRSRAKQSKQSLLIAMFFFSCLQASSQTRILTYTVTRDGRSAGNISLTETRKGGKTHLSVLANMRPRLILSIPVSIKEEAWLENGIIIESFYQRKVNGSTTLIRKTILNDDKYESVAGKETTHIKQYPLKNNILSMFTHEPVGITEVYSNSMAAMLPLKKLRHGVYEVIFPNGNRNVYHYQDNICNKILFDHNLFKAEVNLKSINKL